MLEFIGGVSTGVLLVLGYMIVRMLKADGWDDSNVLNALRVVSHVVMHPSDLPKLCYITPKVLRCLANTGYSVEQDLERPFWYVNKDEFSEIVRTRP